MSLPEPPPPPSAVARANPSPEHIAAAMRELDEALENPECVKRLKRAADTAVIKLPPKPDRFGDTTQTIHPIGKKKKDK